MFTIGHWQPNIADPSFIGWFTVVSYYLCAGLSLACVLKARRAMDRTERRFRIAMTVVVIVLGLSKQFNLPAAVTEIGRIVANRSGGYELRRWLQVFLLLLVTTGLILLIRWSARHRSLRPIWQCCAPELGCLFTLCGLVMLRAISLHQAGALLAAEVFGVPLNRIVELTALDSLIVILLMRIVARSDRT